MPVVLTYHDVAAPAERMDTGFQGPGPDRYKLTPEQFAAHLARGRDAVFTFDDGGRSALTEIAPALERHGRTGIFFVTTERIGTPGFLDADGVRELRVRGHAIGSHSHSHAVLTRLGDDEIEGEWRTSRELLEQILGAPVRTASVPTGFYEPRIAAAAARAGIEKLYTSEPWTRPHRHDGVLVHGRFSVVAGTSPGHVDALARGAHGAVLREVAWWQAKKAAKRAAGPLYARVRSAVLARR
jgi:peptidoglycan/xylan/chitin deacetylase (PgdA/CDA1 family)